MCHDLNMVCEGLVAKTVTTAGIIRKWTLINKYVQILKRRFSVYQTAVNYATLATQFFPNFITYNEQEGKLSGEMAYVNTISILISLTFHLHPQMKLNYTHYRAAVNQLHVNVHGRIMVRPISHNIFVSSLLHPWKPTGTVIYITCLYHTIPQC
jgi:hypothetical protein